MIFQILTGCLLFIVLLYGAYSLYQQHLELNKEDK